MALGYLTEAAVALKAGKKYPVKHEGASRRIDVTCNVSGKDLGSVAREIEERVGTISFKRGYHPEFLGEYAARQASRKRLLS